MKLVQYDFKNKQSPFKATICIGVKNVATFQNATI